MTRNPNNHAKPIVATQPPHSSRLFSAMQPTGVLTLGNYLGALKRFVALQNEYECLFCIADLHALTVETDHASLRERSLTVAATFVAAGIDPDRHILFAQSQVAAHTELAWLLSCVARIGWLNRMTQFKEKAGHNREQASVGLYAYPVLMAADILLYRAGHVPVGNDQQQHLELVREVAQKFNREFHEAIRAHGHAADYFPLAQPLIDPKGSRIRSLRDGRRKMSKSDISAMSYIAMLDTASTISNKIRKARTDSLPLPSEPAGLEDRPEALNLVNIFASLTDQTPASVLQSWGGAMFSAFKPALAEAIVDRLEPIGARTRQLLGDERPWLRHALENGAARANALAQSTLRDVREFMGLRP